MLQPILANKQTFPRLPTTKTQATKWFPFAKQ